MITRIFLFLVAVGLMVWYVLRKWIGAKTEPSTFKQRLQQQFKQSSPSASKQQLMQQCQHCGVHFPADEAITLEGRVYCSEAHARGGRA